MARWIRLGAALSAALLCAPLAASEGEEDDGPKEVELDLKRSPQVQARSAIRRGDFRIARLEFSSRDEIGHYSYGQGTPGLACDGNLGQASTRRLFWVGERELRFAKAYNETLLSDRHYPDRDVCVPVGGDGDDVKWPDFATPRGRPLAPSASVNRAARASRSDLVRSQIADGRPFDSWDRWFRRPLHWAARRGDVETLDILLAAGAGPDARELASPVLLAADSGHGAAVARLLAAGADPLRCGQIDVRLSSGYDLSPPLRLCPLDRAIEHGFAGPVAPLVAAILARGSDYERHSLADDLYKAVDLGRPVVVRAFVEGLGTRRDRYLQLSVLRLPAYRLDRPLLHTLLSLGAGTTARTPAEERLWLAAAKSPRPEPLAMLIWFGRDLNYLPAAERARLEAALPTLTGAGLRPFLIRATEERERVWDSVLAGDLDSLDSFAAAGVDFAERWGDNALSRAVSRDAATVRWMLAHGARADVLEQRRLSNGCSTVTYDFDHSKTSPAQRESFVTLCAEEESRRPRSRPQGGFSLFPLAMAVRKGDPEAIDLLLPLSPPEAAMDIIPWLAGYAPDRAARLPLLTRLSALAAKGPRQALAAELKAVLSKNDTAVAAAILAGFVPTGPVEVRTALDLGYDKAERCRLDIFRFAAGHGVDLSDWRDSDENNLFGLAAGCGSAEFVAFAATVPGIGINELNRLGSTPFELLPDEPDRAAAKAMIALGAKSCEALHGEESDKCGSPGIKPDPAL